MGFRALLMSALMAPVLALAAAPVALVSIVDGGDAILIRGASRFALAEGVRLSGDDIINSGTGTRLLRIEFTDGLLLDLGPGTQAMLSPRPNGGKGRAAARIYLLNGVAKLSWPKGGAPALAAISTPAFDVNSLARTAVFAVQPADAGAFAESGEVVLQERLRDVAQPLAASRSGTIVNLKSGEFFTYKDGEKAAVTQRPTQAFIQRLPRPFLDALPARAQLFKDREVDLRRLGDITYAEAGAWLDADGLRAGFVTRWKALAQDAEFRKGLIANLRTHPEWDRTLYPEKYLPQPVKAGPIAAPAAKP